jgi:hypothetical protein
MTSQILFIETTTLNKKDRKETKKLRVDMSEGFGFIPGTDTQSPLHFGFITINGTKFIVSIVKTDSGTKDVFIEKYK